MEQNHDVAPSPLPPTINPPLNTAAEDRIPQMAQLPQIPPLWPALEMKSNPAPAIRPKPPLTRADWVNAFWADISAQLRRLSVISDELFDGLLLRRETATGSFIFGELRRKYAQLGDERCFATVRVLSPDNLMRGMWQLLWTTKREGDSRQFHSQVPIDPINNQRHLEFNDQPGQFFSTNQFSLPPFVQDYSPGPNPVIEDEFDAVMRDIMREVDEGLWKEQ